MNKLSDAIYAQAFKSLAYLLAFFAVIGFAAWVVSQYWVYIVAILIAAAGVRLYYKNFRYW